MIYDDAKKRITGNLPENVEAALVQLGGTPETGTMRQDLGAGQKTRPISGEQPYQMPKKAEKIGVAEIQKARQTMLE